MDSQEAILRLWGVSSLSDVNAVLLLENGDTVEFLGFHTDEYGHMYVCVRPLSSVTVLIVHPNLIRMTVQNICMCRGCNVCR